MGGKHSSIILLFNLPHEAKIQEFIFSLKTQFQLDVRRTLQTLVNSNEKDRPSDVAILPDGRIVVLFETSPDTKDCPHPMKTFVQIY